jgi:hypothetical protein
MMKHDVPCIGDKSEDLATAPKFVEIRKVVRDYVWNVTDMLNDSVVTVFPGRGYV